MPVDTRDKRFSLVGLGTPVPSLFPNPDGTISASDRGMYLWLYHGISGSTPSAPEALPTLKFYYHDGTDWYAFGGSGVLFSGVNYGESIHGSLSVSDSAFHPSTAMRLQVRIVSIPSSGNIDIAYRYEDSNNYWFIRIDSDGDLRLYQEWSGSTFLKTMASDVVYGGERLDITCEGPQMNVYLDGVEELDWPSDGAGTGATSAVIIDLGTGGALEELSTWGYSAEELYAPEELGEFQGSVHLWFGGVPPAGSHACSDGGLRHMNNVTYMSSNTMSLNGSAEILINDTNLQPQNCFRLKLTLGAEATPTNCRFYCYDGVDTKKRAPGVEAYAFEYGAAVGNWTLINSGESSVGGDNWGERLPLMDKGTASTEHNWYIAVSASPEYQGTLVPQFGATIQWS